MRLLAKTAIVVSACAIILAFVGIRTKLKFAGGRVKPEALVELIDRADEVVVLATPMSDAKLLYRSSNREDLDALKLATRVNVPAENVHCMCIGSPAIELHAKGHLIGLVTSHHAKLLRWNLWKSDAPIADTEAFLKWFDDRKIAGPRAEWDDANKRQQQREEVRERWLEAMPSSIKPFWPTVERSRKANLNPLHDALVKDVPDEAERIRALLSWYGSGAGPWSGFPSYEDSAETLLLRYSTPSILAALEGRKLTALELEGTARLFGGWTFSQSRSDDFGLLPKELKRKLLMHSLESADEDKRARAQHAFGDTP